MSETQAPIDLTGATVSKIIGTLGGAKRVGHACGISPSSVRMWIYNSIIPLKHHSTLLALADADGHTLRRGDLESPVRGSGDG